MSYNQEEYDLHINSSESEIWNSFLTCSRCNNPEKDHMDDWYWAWKIFTYGWHCHANFHEPIHYIEKYNNGFFSSCGLSGEFDMTQYKGEVTCEKCIDKIKSRSANIEDVTDETD